MSDTAQREAAATEKRKWVRTLQACNNRCLFCLDAGMLNGHIRGLEEVRAEIRQGREEGCQRLILSGGEASIHPRFLDFVAYGRELGYGWIQTITNGRVFSYGGFTRKAAAAGLNEVTFSIHGHTPELNDELTGVPGGFHQALKGLINVRRAGLVANVDIVLNRKNVPHLAEMLDFFMGLGVHEFDLLWLVPFGRGFDQHREALFLSPGEAFPHIQRALEGRQRPGLYLWTNRFPVAYLEGYESLIQEPYKLFDEVNGRREMFAAFAREGDGALGCLGERCDYCFLQGFCPTLRRYRRRAVDPGGYGFREAVWDLVGDFDPVESHVPVQDEKGQRERFAALLARHPVARLTLNAATPADAGAALAGLGDGFAVDLRVAELDASDPVLAKGGALAGRLATLTLTSAAQLPAASALARQLPGLELRVELAGDTMDFLRELASPAPPLPLARVTLVLRSRHRLTAIAQSGLDLEAVRGALSALPPGALRVEGLPPCLAGGQRVASPGRDTEGLDSLVPGLLDAEGHLEPFRFTGRHLLTHYHARSLRCEGCAHAASCPGLHINAIRHAGFRVLQPVLARA